MRVAAMALLAVTMAFVPRARAADEEPAPPAPAASAPAPAPEPAAAPDARAASTTPDTTMVFERPPKQFPKLRQASLLHKYQLGIAVLPGVGYRGIFPYQENINCGQTAKRVCTSALPAFLDVQPSFGFAQHWDVLFDLRFGLATDFTGSHQLAVAPGVRYWVDPDDNAKFFATIQVAYDTTAQNDPALSHNNDFALRNSNGFMFEVMRNFGAYIQFGET